MYGVKLLGVGKAVPKYWKKINSFVKNNQEVRQ